MPNPHTGYPLSVEDCEEVSLKNKSAWRLQGFSKAGQRTSFKVNPLNILLDAGMLCVLPPKAILITHGHVDHTWNLPNVIGGAKANVRDGLTPVFFPKQAYQGLTLMLQAAMVLSYPKESCSEEQAWERHFMQPNPVSVGDSFYVNRIKVEVLQAVHTAHSVGYGFSTEKSKLKEEFKDLAANQLKIIELRKQGIEVSEKVTEPEFVFFCDSTIENLLNYSEWKKYPSVVVECTGYPELYESITVHQRGHTHYNDLVEIIKKHKEKNWFLIHSTMKSDKKFLTDFQASLGENVQILSKF